MTNPTRCRPAPGLAAACVPVTIRDSGHALCCPVDWRRARRTRTSRPGRGWGEGSLPLQAIGLPVARFVKQLHFFFLRFYAGSCWDLDGDRLLGLNPCQMSSCPASSYNVCLRACKAASLVRELTESAVSIQSWLVQTIARPSRSLSYERPDPRICPENVAAVCYQPNLVDEGLGHHPPPLARRLLITTRCLRLVCRTYIRRAAHPPCCRRARRDGCRYGLHSDVAKSFLRNFSDVISSNDV